ncbi:branched-chain amino acid ABC transporter substrate-binding protein [Leeia sp. TBRC 13508]|uniref:Branched-chain amino acid ABC transporter substrate-binding protein n=1 Tax=Leeia speluncae TaxID=2884804 RepID=A0ABS8D8V7_9NEIS|nr:branched-chain amino acid ABC transporter substrate-binding protein [Leeia speluncae]MCB6184651.1 branched-chain amino acid ABC transporter substrate-binding protein [Leeia speluncae]
MRSKFSKSAVVACLLSAGVMSHALAEDLTVKIGFAAPLSGPSAHQGADVQHGVEIALAEANAKKIKLDGKTAKFVLVALDDAGDPKTATQVAQRLVDEKVSVVIGHYNSGASIPASKIYAEAGIPQISPSSTNPALTNQGIKTVFRTVNDDSALGRYAGSYLVKNLKAKKVAVIDDRTAYGQGLADEVVKAVKAAGGAVSVREFTNDKSTDFNAILTSIKASKPDALFFAGLDYQAAPMAKQMKNLGVAIPFMNIGNLPNDDFVKMAGDAAENMYAWNYGLPLQNMPRGAKFDKQLKDKYGVGVIQSSPAAYDATWAAITAMQKAGTANPAKYLGALKSVTFDGITGKIQFDAKGDLTAPAATIFQFKSGKWNTLEVKRGI